MQRLNMKVEITDFTLAVTEIVLTTLFVGSFFKITANCTFVQLSA